MFEFVFILMAISYSNVSVEFFVCPTLGCPSLYPWPNHGDTREKAGDFFVGVVT